MSINPTHLHTNNVAIEYNEDNEMNIIMKLHTGDKFPVVMNVSGDVLRMPSVKETAVVSRTVFMKMGPSANEPQFRYNESDHWKNFTEVFTGQIDASLSFSDEIQSLLGQIDLNIYHRE